MVMVVEYKSLMAYLEMTPCEKVSQASWYRYC
jgi:hypothetical protein